MKKAKSSKWLICLVSTITLIVAFFPLGVAGNVRYDNRLWVSQAGIIMSYQSTENEALQGILVPVISFSNDVIYNGLPQSLAEVNPSPEGSAINPELIEITYQGVEFNGDTYVKSTTPPIEVGIYKVVAGYKGDDIYKSYYQTKDISIRPIELKTTDFYTEKPINKLYDGTINVPENTVVGLSNAGVLDSDRNEVGFNFKSANFLSKDVKSIEANAVILKGVTIVGDKGKEYTIVDENKVTKPLKSIDISLQATIDPKTVEVVLVGQDKIYDGNAILNDYELLVKQSDLIKGDGAGARGSENFYPYYGDVNTQQKNVGSYYVWAKGGFYLYGIDGTNIENYTINNQTIVSKKKYDITPARVTVIPAYVSKIQGEADPALTYGVWQDDSGDGFNKGLYGDDVMFGSLERETGEAVGTYDVLLGSLNNANYRIVLVDGADKFEIVEKEDVVAVYDGNDYSNGENETIEKEAESPVPYMGIALLLLLLIAGAIFFGKNRLTKMD